ncbi:HIRAN domain-containing protein [Geobacillus proteiniphilus]|uniref:HIRAN domain-containing protein n=1 Tax=Geobacillus TaxID=129337 RepID=UPI00059D1FD2|nr:DNA-binding protein [Geobacillus sp. LEMMY01]
MRPFVLWLIWQNEYTRQRYHIGNLLHDGEKYVFYYEHSRKRRGLLEALENGYKPHLAFRDMERKYVSDKLFGPFERRLPDRRRPDFLEILRTYGLPRDCTDMDLLRATGGKLATDSYEFVAPIYVSGNHFDFDFYVAGWRYYEGNRVIQHLKVGDEVHFRLEPENRQDSKAVEVLTDKGCKLGYIPAFYSEFMFNLIQNNGRYTARIESIHVEAFPQRKVNISVYGEFFPSCQTQDLDMLHQISLEVI